MSDHTINSNSLSGASVPAQYSGEEGKSSACSQAVLSMLLAVVAGMGATLAAYYLIDANILWTNSHIVWAAVVGGGTTLVVGLTSFLAIKLLNGAKAADQTEAKPVETPTAITPPTAPPSDDEGEDEPGPENPSYKPPILQVSPSRIPVCLEGLNREVKKTIPFTINEIRSPSFLAQIKNKDFTEDTKRAGIVYYDPTNELPIPFVRLYQQLFMLPGLDPDKRKIIGQLFADELVKLHYISDNAVNPYINFLTTDLLKELIACIPEEGLMLRNKLMQLTGAFGNKKDNQTANEWKEIVRQLDKRVGEYTVGTSLDDGGCLFHTLAQQLSQLFGTTISEKTLRMQCYAYLRQVCDVECRFVPSMEDRENGAEQSLVPWTANSFYSATRSPLKDYHLNAIEGIWSSRDIADSTVADLKKPLAQKPEAALWGESGLHGAIIAELYGVTLKIYEPIVEDVEVVIEGIDDEDLNYTANFKKLRKADGTTIKPYEGEGRITLADIGYENTPSLKGAVLHIASMSSHFFPIWA